MVAASARALYTEATDGWQRGQGLAAVELAIRTAMSKLGALLLADLLGLDSGHRGPRIDCGAGPQAEFVSYRDKSLDTVLGPFTLSRAYYHCTDCSHGVVPKDDELGVAGTSLSPRLRAMVARVGAASPFAKASELLATLAGVQLTTKRVERSAEADGQALVRIGDAEAAAVLTGQLAPIGPSTPVAKLYVAMDAPASRPFPPTPPGGPVSTPTGGPGPERSNSGCCSPKPAWTRTATQCATRVLSLIHI